MAEKKIVRKSKTKIKVEKRIVSTFFKNHWRDMLLTAETVAAIVAAYMLTRGNFGRSIRNFSDATKRNLVVHSRVLGKSITVQKRQQGMIEIISRDTVGMKRLLKDPKFVKFLKSKGIRPLKGGK